MFGRKTDSLIEEVRDEQRANGRESLVKWKRLLLLMSDGQWHKGMELAYRVSWRFSQYLLVLRREHGVSWEKRPDPDAPKGENWYEYRMVKGDE